MTQVDTTRPGDPRDPATPPGEGSPRRSVYPGTITFRDLIAKNKRQSLVLAVFMVALAGVVGCVFAGAMAARAGISDIIPSAILGLVVALGLGLLGWLWSYFGGATAILAMSGAQEITHDLDPELFNVVDELRLAAGIPMPRIFLMGDSALNAFATGRDPQHAAVAVTTGLRAALTRDELQGVIGHELSHVRNYDIRFSMLMATMVGLIAFACDAFRRIGFRVMASGGRGKDKGGGLLAVVLLVAALLLSILAPIVAFFIQMAVSREREYLADAGSVELTRNPAGLISALKKLGDDRDPLVDRANRATAHLFIVNPLANMRQSGQALNSAFNSHPPINKRIERLEALLV